MRSEKRHSDVEEQICVVCFKVRIFCLSSFEINHFFFFFTYIRFHTWSTQRRVCVQNLDAWSDHYRKGPIFGLRAGLNQRWFGSRDNQHSKRKCMGDPYFCKCATCRIMIFANTYNNALYSAVNDTKDINLYMTLFL